MLTTQSIEKALALTGKTMDDMGNIYDITDFEIEKFCYYLLSPEFIEKYDKIEYPRVWPCRTCIYFGLAIYEYQKNNPKLLIDLLNKIP